MNSSNSSPNYLALRAKEKRFLYEDSMCAVFLADPPTTLGHIKIISKQDGDFEEHTDAQAERLFILANVCASALFEMLGAQGTNIILDEWIRERKEREHVIIHVIARFQEDGMNFQWQPRPMQESEMEELQKTIKHKTIFINMEEKKLPFIDMDEKKTSKHVTDVEQKRLKRIP